MISKVDFNSYIMDRHHAIKKWFSKSDAEEFLWTIANGSLKESCLIVDRALSTAINNG